MPGSCREPPSLDAEQEKAFAAAASAWPGGAYDAFGYNTAQEALDGYAAFHAHSLSAKAQERKSLVFVPNQYGLGNRLRAMKASLLIAMLTGRVFHVRWDEPFPVHALLKPERIDWRLPEEDGRGALPVAQPGSRSSDAAAQILCLPFATAPPGADCSSGLVALQQENLREKYAAVSVLEVHTFTDLNIYLHTNPHYEELLARFGATCPKRMGCLYDFLFSPQPVVRERLDALLPTAPSEQYYGVQVRNRLWHMERTKLPGGRLPDGRPADVSPGRVVQCMSLYVPPDATVFFTADDDALYRPAKALWGARLLSVDGGVFMPWSRGGKVEASTLGADDEQAVLKAVVDWFALRRASRIVYTYQSSFGKTAAEASDAPNVDVNQTRCVLAEQRWSLRAGGDGAAAARDGATAVTQWEYEWSHAGDGVAYDVSMVPGARGSVIR